MHWRMHGAWLAHEWREWSLPTIAVLSPRGELGNASLFLFTTYMYCDKKIVFLLIWGDLCAADDVHMGGSNP